MNEDYHDEENIDRTKPFAFEEEGDLRGKKIRFWIITIEVVLALGFFVGDKYVTVVKPNIDILTNRQGESAAKELHEVFQMKFDEYGIHHAWMKKKIIPLPSVGQGRQEWFIKLPRDIPIVTLTYDLNQVSAQFGCSAHAIEDTKSGETTVHVALQRRVLYSFIFHRTSEVKRIAAPLSVFIDGIGDAPSDEVEKYLSLHEPIACVMEAKRESRSLYSKLVAANKEIILHIHFLPREESESKFEFSEDLSPQAIVQRVGSIVKEFPRARAFYITSERSIGNAVTQAEQEFVSNNLRPIPTADIQYLDRGESFSQISSRMNDLASLAVKEGYAIGVLELRENTCAFLATELSRLRKRGFEFIRFMKILTDVQEQKGK